MLKNLLKRKSKAEKNKKTPPELDPRMTKSVSFKHSKYRQNTQDYLDGISEEAENKKAVKIDNYHDQLENFETDSHNNRSTQAGNYLPTTSNHALITDIQITEDQEEDAFNEVRKHVNAHAMEVANSQQMEDVTTRIRSRTEGGENSSPKFRSAFRRAETIDLRVIPNEENDVLEKYDSHIVTNTFNTHESQLQTPYKDRNSDLFIRKKDRSTSSGQKNNLMLSKFDFTKKNKSEEIDYEQVGVDSDREFAEEDKKKTPIRGRLPFEPETPGIAQTDKTLQRITTLKAEQVNYKQRCAKIACAIVKSLLAGIMALGLHYVMLFTSFSYKIKVLRFVVNFPLLGIMLSFSLIKFLHYKHEKKLYSIIERMNEYLEEKLHNQKFRIITMSAQIFLYAVCGLFMLLPAYLADIDYLEFNTLLTSLSCLITILVLTLIYELIFVKKKSQKDRKKQTKYVLEKHLENLKRAFGAFQNEIKETQKVLEMQDKLRYTGRAQISNDFMVAYGAAIKASNDAENIMLSKKVDFQEDINYSISKIIYSFVIYLVCLAQLLGLSQYIRIFSVEDKLVEYVFTLIGYFVLAEIPKRIFRWIQPKSGDTRYEDILSSVITSVVFRFVFLEITPLEFYTLFVIKTIYQVVRNILRIWYYGPIKKKMMKKMDRQQSTKFGDCYIPDVKGNDLQEFYGSFSNFACYQISDVASIFSFATVLILNRYAFEELEMTLTISEEYFDRFIIVSAIELLVSALLVSMQVIFIKASRFKKSLYKGRSLEIIYKAIGHNFSLLVSSNLFVFFLMYFFYSNRNFD